MCKSTDLLRRIIVCHTRGKFPDHVVRVPTLRSLSDQRVGCRMGTGADSKDSAAGCAQRAGSSMNGGTQGTDDTNKQQVGGHFGPYSARSAQGSV